MAAPLLMGNDLRNLAPEMKAILTAEEVVAVDQEVRVHGMMCFFLSTL